MSDDKKKKPQKDTPPSGETKEPQKDTPPLVETKEPQKEAPPVADTKERSVPATKKVRIATTWLDGCSGCHMSFLDLDERILDVAAKIEMVYGPLVDFKEFPEGVDVTLVEGAVSSHEDEEKVRLIRNRSYLVVSFGDCAVTANVPAMRNQFKIDDIMTRAYVENATAQPGIPSVEVPHLLKRARPVHEFINVDVFLPGCPPPPDAILFAVSELLEGRIPDLSGRTRFGA
jgi:NAD-reducing hydrogenase small subunit